MEKNTSSVMKKLVAAGWRQRLFLLVPLLVMIPLSILGARYLPKTYIATAFMAMQESDRNNPFVKKSGTDYTLVKRVEGLEAWLKSKHVLSGILRPYTVVDPEKDPSGFLLEIREFRKAFKLELVGNDFLRFSLKGNNPKGMGEKLEAITSKFLEGLLIPDESIQNASQAIIGFYRKKVKKIGKRQDELKRLYNREGPVLEPGTGPVLMKEHRTRLKELQAIYRKNKQQLAEKSQLASQGQAGQGTRISGVPDTGGSISILRQLEEKGAGLKKRIGDLKKRIGLQTAANEKPGDFEKQWRQLQEEEKAARIRMAHVSQQLVNVNIKNSLGILNAPESIKVIDAPRDPVRPATSGLKTILAGILGALFLGLTLAVLAETTDQRIYTATEITELAGAPVIGYLPDTRNRKSGDRDPRPSS